MKIDRTKFTAQYENGVIKSMWVSVEVELDAANGDSPHAALDLSKEISDKWYAKNNSTVPVIPASYAPIPEIQVQQEEKSIGLTVEDIMSCQDLKTLESYRLIVNKKGGTILEAYNMKHKELSQSIQPTIMPH